MLNKTLENGIKLGLWGDEVDSVTKNRITGGVTPPTPPTPPEPTHTLFTEKMTKNIEDFAIASTLLTPFSGSAFNAFDDDVETFVYGAISDTKVIVDYQSLSKSCKANKVDINASGSGNVFVLYGVKEGNAKEIFAHTISLPFNNSFEFTTNDYYDKFEFAILGGAMDNTPRFFEIKLYGEVKANE